MILREAGLLVVAGIALGTFFTLLMAQTAKALIFGMQPNDPVTLLLAIIALAAIAILASFLPAQRAATVNPIQALREE
jgi:ABC-type antimicrobial peptide transport system permease subunit